MDEGEQSIEIHGLLHDRAWQRPRGQDQIGIALKGERDGPMVGRGFDDRQTVTLQPGAHERARVFVWLRDKDQGASVLVVRSRERPSQESWCQLLHDGSIVRMCDIGNLARSYREIP